MSVSLCCKLSKEWRREKKLLDVSSGRGCTDTSFPDIFTVLAELPCWNRGQSVTSSSKPEQTQQPVVSLRLTVKIAHALTNNADLNQTTAENAYIVCFSSITVSERVTTKRDVERKRGNQCDTDTGGKYMKRAFPPQVVQCLQFIKPPAALLTHPSISLSKNS